MTRSRTCRSRHRRSSPSGSPPISRHSSPSASTAPTHHPGSCLARAGRRVPAPYTEAIGREADVITLVELLAQEAVRLVTLIGPGGIGKSRLAIEVAQRIAAARGPRRLLRPSRARRRPGAGRPGDRRRARGARLRAGGSRGRPRTGGGRPADADRAGQLRTGAGCRSPHRAAVHRAARGDVPRDQSRSAAAARRARVRRAASRPARSRPRPPRRHRAGLARRAALPRPRPRGEPAVRVTTRTSTPWRRSARRWRACPSPWSWPPLASACSRRHAARPPRPATPSAGRVGTGSARSPAHDRGDDRVERGPPGCGALRAAGATGRVRRRLQPRSGRGDRRRYAAGRPTRSRC